MPKLALRGGTCIRTKPFPPHNTIGEEEKRAVMEVMNSGDLSRFLGTWHPDFYGGRKVQEFERAWAEFCDAQFAVSMNSNTSGLFAAVGAASIGAGDEVIVTPYSMSATATAILAYNAVPVFADIDRETFTLDPRSVEQRITSYTKAIMVTDLLGHPADLGPIMDIARRHNLVVIEDAAQAPGAVYQGRKIGSISHMTVFSLNYHKHIHTGEGGIVTTNDPNLAERLQLIRNHGESVVAGKGVTNLMNTFGFNFRLTELQAAIGTEQLKKLPDLLRQRLQNAEYLNQEISRIPGIVSPPVREGCVHTYYVQAFLFDRSRMGISREDFVKAVAAELGSSPDRDWDLIYPGYGTPLYLLPMYQQRAAYAGGCPFSCGAYKGTISYGRGLCPVTEDIEDHKIIGTEFMRPPATLEDMKDVVDAFAKVYECREELVA